MVCETAGERASRVGGTVSKLVHQLIGSFPESFGCPSPFRRNRSPADITVHFRSERSRDLTGLNSASSSCVFVLVNCCLACL